MKIYNCRLKQKSVELSKDKEHHNLGMEFAKRNAKVPRQLHTEETSCTFFYIFSPKGQKWRLGH
jgi:hypothetical protein